MMIDVLANIMSLIVIFASASLLLLIVSFKNRESKGSFINHLSILVLLVATALELKPLLSGKAEYMGHMVTSNSLTSISLVILYITALITIVVINSFKDYKRPERGDASILVLFSVCGMQIMILASEFILMLIGLEISSMALFVLSGMNNRSRLAIEGTLKYLIFSSLFFAIALLGVAIIYAFMLSLGINYDMLSFNNLGVIGKSINSGNLIVIIAFIFVLSMFLLKLGIVPFHMWMPDFYEGSPSYVSGFASTSIKVASLIVLINIFSKMFNSPLVADYHITFKLLELLSIITIVVSTLIALHQTNAKRLIAYSSIANASIIMLGFLAYISSQGILKENAKVNILFFVLIYSLMNLLAFGIVSRLEKGGGEIQSFNGLYYKNPFLSILLSLALFSLAGLPPTAGFFAKLFIFKSAIDSGLIVTSVIMILMTIVSLYYYLNFALIMFLRKPVNDERYEGNHLFNLTMGIVSILIIAGGIVPDIFNFILIRLIK